MFLILTIQVKFLIDLYFFLDRITLVQVHVSLILLRMTSTRKKANEKIFIQRQIPAVVIKLTKFTFSD